MALDVDSPDGQQATWEERHAGRMLEKFRPGLVYYCTKKEGSTCAVDAFVYRNAEMIAAATTKSRDCSLETLRGPWANEWLLTMKQPYPAIYSRERLDEQIANAEWKDGELPKAVDMAKQLCVPLWGLLWTTQDNMLSVVRLTDSKGMFVVKYEVKRTWTQATINDKRKTLRDNAYIKMKTSKPFKGDPCPPNPEATVLQQPYEHQPLTDARRAEIGARMLGVEPNEVEIIVGTLSKPEKIELGECVSWVGDYDGERARRGLEL